MNRAMSSLMFVAGLVLVPTLHAEQRPAYGPHLEGFSYPHPIKRFEFSSQRQPLSMAYMDVQPAGKANGRTVVLMHGKNFCAANLGGKHRGALPEWLSSNRTRPDWVLRFQQT